MSKSKIHEMGSALREGGVGVTPNVWEAYLLHQTGIVDELVKQLGDFAESNSAVLLGGATMEKKHQRLKRWFAFWIPSDTPPS